MKNKNIGAKSKNIRCFKSPYILRQYIEIGKIKRPDSCINCGRIGKVHGHHSDYSKPLEVIWLCPSCHTSLHYKEGEGKNGGFGKVIMELQSLV